jgi:hypothetical protein
MVTCLYQKVYSAHYNLRIIIQVSYKLHNKIFPCIKMSYLTSVSLVVSSENVMPVAGTTFEAPS